MRSHTTLHPFQRRVLSTSGPAFSLGRLLQLSFPRQFWTSAGLFNSTVHWSFAAGKQIIVALDKRGRWFCATCPGNQCIHRDRVIKSAVDAEIVSKKGAPLLDQDTIDLVVPENLFEKAQFNVVQSQRSVTISHVPRGAPLHYRIASDLINNLPTFPCSFPPPKRLELDGSSRCI